MITHTWYERAKCTCGYIWTTEHNQSVVCRCGSCSIQIGQVISIGLPVDETEFKQAVAADYGHDVNNIIVEYGSA